MEIPAVVEGVAGRIHVQTEIDEHRVKRGSFLRRLSYHAVYVHLVVVIPLVVEGVALVGISHAGVEQCLTVILIFAAEYYRAGGCAGGVVIVIYHGMLTVIAVLRAGLVPCGSGRAELAVHQQVVEHPCIGVLLNIDSAALLAVASPAGADDGVVVGAYLSLMAHLALV